ncbi:unnamed protein product [Lactuca virosa]|uniref:Nrap protein domain-containing protein n=1 Tax=Lactuca virosa TaxID=75947 RepID=A0AAU9LH60_9ASTR|nr:unnamed protein product [Lactuca virosa]
MLFPDKGSGGEAEKADEKVDENDEGQPLPGTARHREFYPEEALTVGISVSLPEAFDEYTGGPFFGNKEEALKFRKFWGDKAELYQFKSGTMECVWVDNHKGEKKG